MERRHYLRTKTDSLSARIVKHSSFKVSDSDEKGEEVQVADISERGMLYFSERKRTEGEMVDISFTLPKSSIAIKTEARIVYCYMVGMLHRIGAQFKNLGLAEQRLLQSFIETQAGDE